MVSKLRQFDIYIDEWNTSVPNVCTHRTYLLTHVHTDHSQIPQRFACTVWTTDPLLLPTWQKKRQINIGTWQQTCNGIDFYSFPTHHTFHSVGFWFPSVRVLYIGDSRLTTVLLDQVKSWTMLIDTNPIIVYDALMEKKRPYVFPDTCSLLFDVLQHECHTLQCVHYGILFYLRHCLSVKWCIDESIPDDMRYWIRKYDMESKSSRYRLVGPKYLDNTSRRIVPSLLWFVIHDDVDPNLVQYDGNRIRIFCGLHASHDEIMTWKTSINECTFEPMVSVPI